MKSIEKSGETRPASERPPVAREERLREGLEEVFLREGFRRVTIGDLAARLHCSRQTLYQLASSKEDLFLLVLDRFLSRIQRMGSEAARARDDSRERLVALVEPGVSELRQASSLFFADVAGFPPAKRRLERHQTERRQDVRTLIEEGIRRRTFNGFDSHLAADVFVAAVQRVMDPDFLVEVGLSPSEAIREAESLLLYGLLHPDNRGARPRGSEQSRGKGNRKPAARPRVRPLGSPGGLATGRRFGR